MTKHIILWTLDGNISSDEKYKIKKNAKANLESLLGKIDGLVDLKVNINPLESSNCDMMLDATFENSNSLLNYSKHPEHVAVANTYVRPFIKSRVCMDYDI